MSDSADFASTTGDIPLFSVATREGMLQLQPECLGSKESSRAFSCADWDIEAIDGLVFLHIAVLVGSSLINIWLNRRVSHLLAHPMRSANTFCSEADRLFHSLPNNLPDSPTDIPRRSPDACRSPKKKA